MKAKRQQYHLFYFIGQGFKGLWDNRMMTLASIFLLTFCLNIIGAFYLLIYNIDENVDKIGDLNRISAFVEPNVTYTAGEEVPLPSVVKLADNGGSTFLGWSTDPSATSAQWAPGGTYLVKGEDAVSGAITLYAIFSDAKAPSGVRPIYNASGIDIEGEMPQDETYYLLGDEITLPTAPSPRYLNVSFLGWSTDPDADHGMEAGSKVTLTEEHMTAGKIVFYAIWSEKTTFSAVSIVYDMNGRATAGDIPTDESVRLALVQEQITSLGGVIEVTLVSKEQALEEELEKNPELGDSLHEGDNPYPDMFLIGYDENTSVDNLAYQLSNIDGIYKIDAKGDYAENIDSIKNGVILVFVWFLAIIFIFSVLIIINTVKLSAETRKDEISLMSYIGATPIFISLPYVFEGVIIGLLSGTIAFFTEKLLYGRVQEMLTTDFAMITVLPFEGFEQMILIAFLVIGVFTGVVGSCISLSKYTNV